MKEDTAFFNDYYAFFFPRISFCKLLAREWTGESKLRFRELAFETDSSYIRYRDVCNAQELIEHFVRFKPLKLHIGALYTQQPRLKKKIALTPVSRELVFDIDLDDYPLGVRADDTQAVDTFFPIAAFGLTVVKNVLKNQYDFAHFLLTYSGRRGCHLTVLDEKASVLTDEARSAIVCAMQPPPNRNGQKGRFYYDKLLDTPPYDKLFDSHVHPFWRKMCVQSREDGGIGILDAQNSKYEFLCVVGSRLLKEDLDCVQMQGMTGSEFWEHIWKQARNAKTDTLWRMCRSAVCHYVWPRLDAAVTKSMGHLSKSVFSAHPKTGRLCVPITGNELMFDPSTCPTAKGVVQRDPVEEALFLKAIRDLQKTLDELESHTADKLVCEPSAVVYDMRNADRTETTCNTSDSNDTLYTRRCRFMAVWMRIYFARASERDSTVVHVYNYLVPHERYDGGSGSSGVHTLLPGSLPPVRVTSRFPYESFVSSLYQASERAGENVECDAEPVFVLFSTKRKHRDEVVDEVESRRAAMADPVFVNNVNTKWSREAIESYLSEQFAPLWKEATFHVR